MRNFRTAAILLAMPLLMTACSKPAEPVAEATENTDAANAMGNAMDAGTNATETGMAADVGNSGVPELSSGGPGIITKSTTVEGTPAPAPAPAPAPTK